MTRSLARAPRRRPASVAALLVGVLLLAGCAGGQRDPGSYTGAVKDNFTGQCWVQVALDTSPKVTFDPSDSLGTRQDEITSKVPKGQVSAAKKYCTCVYSALTEKVKFGEFKKINERLREDGGKLPTSFTDAYESCELPPA